MSNTNLEVIKYFVNELYIDINYVNKNGNNAFIYACFFNSSLEIIKFLVKQYNINLKKFMNNDKNTALLCACYFNTIFSKRL